MYNKKALRMYEKGLLSEQKEDLSAAEKFYKKAIKVNQDFYEAYNNLGNIFMNQWRYKSAELQYRKALKFIPHNAMVLSNIGNSLMHQGKNKEAIDWLNKAIKVDAGYADAYTNLGNVLQEQGELDKAVVLYNKAITLNPKLYQAYISLGVVIAEIGEYQDAIKCYKQAIQLRPNFSDAYNNLCEIYDRYNMIPELKETLSYAQDALPNDDKYLLYRKAQLASREKNYKEARDLLERINQNKMPQKIRQGYSELLSKIYDKLGQFDDAFEAFTIANNIVSKSVEARKFSAKRYHEKVIKLSNSWSIGEKIVWTSEQFPDDEKSPVFLVGFPRSGTTLLDTILRSHPDVYVVEEKPMVQVMASHIDSIATPDVLSTLHSDQLCTLRKMYFDELSKNMDYVSAHNIVVDKMPLNITSAGLINRVFPDSKFILSLRHPYDCVLSCYMQNFKLNDAMSNFLTLQQSAKLYDTVMNLWVNYENSLNLEVGAIRYESLVQDLRGTTEPLLNFLGLDWHDDLENYQQTAYTRGRIRTPSYNQVTQNLYTQASGRWKNYKDKMNVVSSTLDPWVEKFNY